MTIKYIFLEVVDRFEEPGGLMAVDARERIRRELRAGLNDLDERIREAVSRYLRGELSLREYLDLRSRLEAEKEKKVLENLRRFHSPKSGTRPR